MFSLGTQFWPDGPSKIDWTIDLGDGSFGPLRLHSSTEEIKNALGKPDNPRFFSAQILFYYERFHLYLTLNAAGLITDVSLEIPERTEFESELDSEAGPFSQEIELFDPTVKLPGVSSQRLRRVTVDDLRRAFGQPSDSAEFYYEWERRHFIVYAEIAEDGKAIASLGWMAPEE